MAKAFLLGNGWSVRERYEGKSYCVSGHQTKFSAEFAMHRVIASIQHGPAPESVWAGPNRVKLAQALRTYGLERLHWLNRAPREMRRINRYLVCAGLSPLKAGVSRADLEKSPSAQQVFVLCPDATPSMRLRTALAGRAVASVRGHDIQAFLDALHSEGASPSALAGERDFLRSFFNYVRGYWDWAYPIVNPATNLLLPRVERGRQSVDGPPNTPVTPREAAKAEALGAALLASMRSLSKQSPAQIVAQGVNHG